MDIRPYTTAHVANQIARNTLKFEFGLPGKKDTYF